jgi:hypothetical protein
VARTCKFSMWLNCCGILSIPVDDNKNQNYSYFPNKR